MNNLFDTINNQFKKGRDQSIIGYLAFIIEYLMVRLVVVQKEIDKAFGPLNPTTTTVLQKIKKAVEKCTCVFCRNNEYQVIVLRMDQCMVDMKNHTCSYRKWELTGIPCEHASVEI